MMTKPIKTVRFNLAINREQFQEYYRTPGINVLVQAENGIRIQFPARVIQPFVLHDGVHGDFQIRFDADNRLIDIKRV